MRPSSFVGALFVPGLLLGHAGLSSAQTTRIHAVLDGASVSGAEVFVDGQSRGRTDGRGNLDVDRALLTDGTSVISARLQVYEVPAFLPGHDDARSPGGWMMRAYVTSVLIDDAGTVNLHRVADRTATQELVLRRDNVLIGLQLLASVDWDMSDADFTRLMQTFQVASRYLWNATDGQFVFETVKISDQARNWDRSMFRLYADNTPRPRATAGGYLGQNLLGQLVGSYVTIPWRDSTIHLQGPNGPWAGHDPRTFVHEFGHLGFALGDEYSDIVADTCTPKRNVDAFGTPFGPSGEKSACVMDSQFNSVKFCSDQDPNPHNYTSLAPDDCWAGIRGSYSDPAGARWILKTPVTRGAIVGTLRGASGTATDAFPLEWNTGFVVTNTGWGADLCRPFLQTVTFADGTPAGASTVKLLFTTVDPSQHTWISEGKTFASGDIAILGAHQGDTVMTENAFNALTTCPQGTWPQGPLGVLSGDLDGDRVPDGFDTCPNSFNPYDLDTTMWVVQAVSTCPCTTDAECLGGLVCATPAGGTAKQCILPACRSDADCGVGRTCQGTGAAAACVASLGARCTTNADCPIGRCDVGDGTSRTGLCVPNGAAGRTGDICSHDNQCASGNCSGLAPNAAGGWQPGTCGASAQKGLGEYCFNNPQCVSGYCDAGDGTSKTHLCMPNNNGQPGEICSHDNQCTSRNCGGLAPRPGGGWQPGRCNASDKKPLGDYCFGNAQCETGYCDAGDGTSKTNRCMPNRDGQTGQICSHDNQCASLNCSGLSNLAAAVPGTCAPKRALGVSCSANGQCSSSYCDAGWGTSKTYRCMPLRDGQNGDICSHDNQCASLNCGGLMQNNVGEWVPGACAGKRALGAGCSANSQCGSAYCDAGDGTSKTNRCMPNTNGRDGDICSHDNQCASLNCGGLTQNSAGAWVPGACADKRALGAACSGNSQCSSAYCDAGWGTSKTNRCMPNRNGSNGDICSNDNQCVSVVCAGLRTDSSGNWIPGACASKKALNDPCSQNYQCASGYCDSGWNTSKTDRCMPNTNGRPGDICSHDNQCTSRVCVGLRAQGGVWIPGSCR